LLLLQADQIDQLSTSFPQNFNQDHFE
jgi:hypothetical protein